MKVSNYLSCTPFNLDWLHSIKRQGEVNSKRKRASRISLHTQEVDVGKVFESDLKWWDEFEIEVLVFF